MFSEIFLPEPLSKEFEIIYGIINSGMFSQDERVILSEAIDAISDFKGVNREYGSMCEDVFCGLNRLILGCPQDIKNLFPSVHGSIGMENKDNPLDSFPVGW